MQKVRVGCGIVLVGLMAWLAAPMARAAVLSPVSSGLLVGLDGSSALVDGSGKVKVWYDQVAAGGTQDYGQQTAGLQPTLLSNVPMPNGTLRNVVDFTANAAGTTGSRLDSMSGATTRINDFSSAFTSGADSVYSNTSSVTWFLVLSTDTLPSGQSRAIFTSDFTSPSGIVDIQTTIQTTGGTSKIRSIGRNADGSSLGPVTGLNTFDDQVGTNWFIAAIQYNGSGSSVNGFAANTLTATVLRQDGQTEVASGPVDGVMADHILASLGGPMSTTTANLFDGKIAEFLYYNTTLSAGDTASVMGYLSEKYFVPEPSSIVLIGIAGMALARFGRRRRAAAVGA